MPARAKLQITAPSLPTYRIPFNFSAVSGDSVQIPGLAGKIVRVLAVYIHKPSAQVTVRLLKKSTLAAGGTSADVTPVSHSTRNPAAGLVAKTYTVAPVTPGTLVGEVGPPSIVLETTDVMLEEFGTKSGQAIELCAATEALCINVNATVTLKGYVELTIE